MSPRKVRLVVDVIRGHSIDEAEHRLMYIQKDAVRPVLKLLKSAIANAENNFQIKKDNLFVKKAFVDMGPSLKRWKPRAFGRAAPILKKSSHVTIILDERVAAKGLKAKGKKSAKAAKPVDVKAKTVQPVVDFKEIKHEAKGKPSSEEAAAGEKKPFINLKGIKDKFSRRLGER
jgi:large subunit ribosomal protein L22